MIYNLTINIDGDFSDNWKEEDFKQLFEQGKGYFEIDVISHEELGEYEDVIEEDTSYDDPIHPTVKFLDECIEELENTSYEDYKKKEREKGLDFEDVYNSKD